MVSIATKMRWLINVNNVNQHTTYGDIQTKIDKIIVKSWFSAKIHSNCLNSSISCINPDPYHTLGHFYPDWCHIANWVSHFTKYDDVLLSFPVDFRFHFARKFTSFIVLFYFYHRKGRFSELNHTVNSTMANQVESQQK